MLGSLDVESNEPSASAESAFRPWVVRGSQSTSRPSPSTLGLRGLAPRRKPTADSASACSDAMLRAAVLKAVENGLLPEFGFPDQTAVNWSRMHECIEAALRASDRGRNVRDGYSACGGCSSESTSDWKECDDCRFRELFPPCCLPETDREH